MANDTKTTEAANMKMAKIEMRKAAPHPTPKIDFTVQSQTNKAIIRLTIEPRINATMKRVMPTRTGPTRAIAKASAREALFPETVLPAKNRARALTTHPMSSGKKGLNHSTESPHHKAFKFNTCIRGGN